MIDRDDAVPTDAPKSDPSRNATTHGLTAKRPLSEEEDERFRILVDHWTSKHLPETLGEEAIVQVAAVEYVRFLRCVQADERQKGPNARKALDEWRDKGRHAIRRRAQDLRDDPEGVAAELQESAFGIDWLLGHWRRLLGQIDTGLGWSGDDLSTAMRLMGRPPRKPGEEDVDGLRLWDTVWVASPSALDTKAQRGLVDAEAAAELRALVADRIARLEALRPLAWEEVEGPQADAVESAAMVDSSKEGQLRNRYRREASGAMLRCLGMLNRLKVDRSKMDDRLARQERLASGSRSSSAGDRPAWVAPSTSRPASSASEGSDRPTPAGPSAVGSAASRNGPPGPPPTADDDRRKHHSNNEIGANTGERSTSPTRRTGAHPGMSEGPSADPTAGHPDARPPHPGRPTRPELPDQAA